MVAKSTKIRFENKGGGYFFNCEAETDAPIVILLPAIAGLNDYVEHRTASLVQSGYRVFLLDYYFRTKTSPDLSSPQKIGEAVAGLSDVMVREDISQAVEYLNKHCEGSKSGIGALGFCIGGMFAFLSGCYEPSLKAVVDYYGLIKYPATNPNKPVSPLDVTPELKAPLLAHFGDHDRLISEADIDEFRSTLKAEQKHFEMCLYSGAPHAFDEDFRPEIYHPVASGEAWNRTIRFLNWHMKAILPRS